MKLHVLIRVFLKSVKIVKIDITGMYNNTFFLFLFGPFEVKVD